MQLACNLDLTLLCSTTEDSCRSLCILLKTDAMKSKSLQYLWVIVCAHSNALINHQLKFKNKHTEIFLLAHTANDIFYKHLVNGHSAIMRKSWKNHGKSTSKKWLHANELKNFGFYSIQLSYQRIFKMCVIMHYCEAMCVPCGKMLKIAMVGDGS